MRSTITFDYKDVQKFQKTCKMLGEKTAVKAATKAAQKGSNVVGKAIRAAAPKRTGALKGAFKKRKEKSSVYGKVVYYYAVDKDKNEIFQKPIKDVGKYGGKKDTGYYPASVEYGYLVSAGGGSVSYVTRAKGSNQYSTKKKTRTHMASRKTEGTHFVKRASESVQSQVQATISKTLNEELGKAWLQ